MVPLTAPVKATAVVLAPLHMVCAVGVLTVGVGFTVILKFCEVPIQPLAVGITMTLAVSGVAPAFIAVKEAILPVPDAPRPMPGSVLVQPYVVPLTAPLKFTAVEAMPLHNTWLVGAVTVGVGFTVITKLAVLPVHPLAAGITIIVPVSATVPLLVPAKEAMLPAPDAPRPIAVLLFVQV
jgi:hypothetical protein